MSMHPIKKVYCRAFQTVFHLAIPLLPYRRPEILTGTDLLPGLFREKGVAWDLTDGVLTVNGGRGYDAPALDPGEYRLPGNVSSQFFTGLLFALPLLDGDSTIKLRRPVESRSYIKLTREVQARFGVETVVINYVGPVIGAHSGPGTVALFFLGSQR